MVLKKYVASVMAGLMLISASSASAASLLQQSDFEQGVSLPWHISENEEKNSSSSIVDGEYCVRMEYPGTEVWDVQIRHREMVLQKDHVYTASFMVRADKDCTIRAKIGDQGKPYAEESFIEVKIVGGAPAKKVVMPQAYDQNSLTSFKSKEDHPLAEFAIHMGGKYAASGITPASPNNIYFDDFKMDDPQFIPTATPTPRPISDVKVNQLGYLPNAAKKATVKTESTSPLAWQLKNSSGTTVANGTTTPFGSDADSGDIVQIIDFSSYKTEGTGYKLSVTGSTIASNPFDISTTIYDTIQKDALQYFYHARSGTPIVIPYAVKDEWTRVAGHPTDTATASGGYTVDATGGWYDAGDHGKYVVNGGISVWTMMNQFERAKVLGTTDKAYGAKDGQMNIPENSNSIPDLLDEAKWEMDMLVKMQVPDGKTKAGMAHHKFHDEKWTPLATRPEDDDMKRIVKDPTTAATLNLAAVGAQAYRVFKDYDSTSATKYLTAAEKAWTAAVANPAIFYPMVQELGGGAYGDDYVDDDFYWAACELYAATGKSVYYDYIKESKYYLTVLPTLTGGEANALVGVFDWGNTASAGTLTLALTENDLTADEKATARKNIAAACDEWLANMKAQGYGTPVKSAPDTGFPWGSNSFAINIGIAMAYAYDYTGDGKYFNGVTEIMDYMLGRNPLDQSYVTGYGEAPLLNPHHRFFSYQADNTFPKAPPGFLSGGPNSGCQDPWISGAGYKGRPPEKVFYDHIESWSSNEVTINWNAPLAWVTAYLAENPNGGGGTATPTPVDVVYGDANGDKKVDSADYTLLRSLLLGKVSTLANPDWKTAMDVKKDGKIDSADYTILRKYLLKIITSIPV